MDLGHGYGYPEFNAVDGDAGLVAGKGAVPDADMVAVEEVDETCIDGDTVAVDCAEEPCGRAIRASKGLIWTGGAGAVDDDVEVIDDVAVAVEVPEAWYDATL